MSAFQNYFVDTLKNRYAKFEGRASRSEYWYFVLFYVLIYIVLAVLSGLIANVASSLSIIPMALIGIFVLAILIPSLAVAVRRLHDTGKSGWWLLLGLIPLVSLVLLVFFCMESQPGENQYGANPWEDQGMFDAT